MENIKALNFTADHIKNTLECPVKVSAADVTASSSATQSGVYTAIWDTGATGSVITARVAHDLNLVPTSMTEVHTAGGKRNCNVYLIDIELPNNIRVINIPVTEADMTTQDVLIGMDIISLGDLALTNYKGKTNLSFRIPSLGKIDFVEELNRHNQKSKSAVSHKGKSKGIKNKRKQERQARRKGRK